MKKKKKKKSSFARRSEAQVQKIGITAGDEKRKLHRIAIYIVDNKLNKKQDSELEAVLLEKSPFNTTTKNSPSFAGSKK